MQRHRLRQRPSVASFSQAASMVQSLTHRAGERQHQTQIKKSRASTRR
jgi:hypothetical protein